MEADTIPLDVLWEGGSQGSKIELHWQPQRRSVHRHRARLSGSL